MPPVVTVPEPSTMPWTDLDRPILSGILHDKIVGKSGRIKRLVVETPSGLVEVRLPRFLSRVAECEAQVGEPLRLWVKGGRSPRALALVPLRPQPILPSSCQTQRTCVMVCTGKGCGRRGGDELHQRMLLAAKNWPGVEIKKCGCLKRCSRGPNIKIPGVGVTSVKASEAPQLMSQFGLN